HDNAARDVLAGKFLASRHTLGHGLTLQGKTALPEFVSGPHEGSEERMRLERSGLEFRVELAAQKPGVIADLDDFDVGAIGRCAGELQSFGYQGSLESPVELVTMAVPFGDLEGPLGLVSKGAWLQSGSPRAQPHRATQLV